MATMDRVAGWEQTVLFEQTFVLSPYESTLYFYTSIAYATRQSAAYFKVGDILFVEHQLTGTTNFNLTVEKAWLSVSRDSANASSVRWNLTESLSAQAAPIGHARRSPQSLPISWRPTAVAVPDTPLRDRVRFQRRRSPDQSIPA